MQQNLFPIVVVVVVAYRTHRNGPGFTENHGYSPGNSPGAVAPVSATSRMRP